MTGCSSCRNYNDGEGTKACLHCSIQKRVEPGNWRKVAPSLPSYLDIDDIATPVMDKSILTILSKMPLTQSLPLIAFYWLNAQYHEIAEAFGVPKATLSGRIRRAKDHIRRKIKKEGQLAPRRRNKGR